jgi:hypothetical protein
MRELGRFGIIVFVVSLLVWTTWYFLYPSAPLNVSETVVVVGAVGLVGILVRWLTSSRREK